MGTQEHFGEIGDCSEPSVPVPGTHDSEEELASQSHLLGGPRVSTTCRPGIATNDPWSPKSLADQALSERS